MGVKFNKNGRYFEFTNAQKFPDFNFVNYFVIKLSTSKNIKILQDLKI